MKISSLTNLAMFYLKQGNIVKYQSYIDQVEESARKKITVSNSILSSDEIQNLFQLKLYSVLAEFFEKFSHTSQTESSFVYLYGESLLRLGKINEALQQWNTLSENDKEWEFLNIRKNQILHYPELVFGHTLLHPQEPEVHVLILTHNRRDYLRKTLACLRATQYKNYKIFLVDNGSSDGTGDILPEEFALFPKHIAAEYACLPTNIGRPAGHNWLLTAWEHSSAEYLSILDDDLLAFDPNWLTIFVNSFTVKPGIGVVGGKTVGSDLLIQDATSIIKGITPEGSIDFFTHRGEFDWGQHNIISNISDYTIGCACLYKRELFDNVGHFDIRFSPSQGVDIDHGIRIRKAGYDMIYNGNTTFVHAQLTSEGIEKDRARLGNSLGNFLKLGHKYLPEEFQAIIAARAKRQQAFDASKGIFELRS